MNTAIDLTSSIQQHVPYQQALIEATEATSSFARLHPASIAEEKLPEFVLAQEAMEASCEALTRTIDCYIARRIGQVLQDQTPQDQTPKETKHDD